MRNRIMKRTLLLCSLLAIACGLSQAQVSWQTDGVPVCTATGDQMYPVIVPDQKGGGIIIWQDYRAGNWDLYAQRVDSAGNACWTSNGTAIATGSQDQRAPKAISDMRGGAIVVYNRMDGSIWYDIWAQRVDSMGNPCWGANGVDVSNLTNSIQLNYRICSDSNGGLLLSWMNDDTMGFDGYDAIMQRIDSTGSLVWGLSGKVIAGGANDQGISCIVEDKRGGAIMAFGSSPSLQIYGQRVDSDGNIKWGLGGVTLCTLTVGDRSIGGITTDNRGGGIVVWYDLRNSGVSKGDIYAQRVDSSGNVLWQLNGVPVCTDTAQQDQPVITTDGSGGAFFSWYDLRGVSGTERKIYSQKIDSLSNNIWQTNGVPICAAGGGCAWPCIIRDGNKGAIISWIDWRTGENNIYAQELDSTGNPYWLLNGISVCSAVGSQSNDYYNRQNHIITDDRGGAITVWHDTRSGTSIDIYAQRLSGNNNGVAGKPDGSGLVYQIRLMVYPNPFKAFAQIAGVKQGEEVKVYDIAGRLVERGNNNVIGKKLSAGVYFVFVNGFQPTKITKIK